MNPAFQARLRARSSLIGLNFPSDSHADQLERYFLLLSRWNKRINLTALPLDPPSDQAIDRLLMEPLAAVQYLRESPQLWVDLGSGGGSPAVPMKIMNPWIKLVMVESRSRKAAFLREVVRDLGLGDVTVLAERFEVSAERPDLTAQAGLITARAVRADAGFLDVSRRLLRRDGQLLFFSRAGAEPDFPPKSFELVRAVELLPDDHSTLLLDFRVR